MIRRERVLFTGYLTHRELKHLFPCCDVAVFASVVPEAGPLVFLEAMAAGCFPLGIDQAGLAERIETAAEALPPPAAALMKLDPNPAKTISDIARNAVAALSLGGAHKAALRQVAVARHDWTNVAARLAGELDGLAG